MYRFKIFLFNLILIALGSLLIFSNKQIKAASLNRSEWDSDHMVAQPETNFPSGLLPRGPGVEMSISEGRNNKFVESWTASIENGRTYFCAKHGTMLRFGRFDSSKYFLNKNGNGKAVGSGGAVIFGDGKSPSYNGDKEDGIQGSISRRMKESKENVFERYPADNEDWDYKKPTKAENIYSRTRSYVEMHDGVKAAFNAVLSAYGVTYDDVRMYYTYHFDLPVSGQNPQSRKFKSTRII